MAETLKSKLLVRAASAAVLGPAVLGIVYLGGIWYDLLIGVAALGLLFEWVRMTGTRPVWLALGLTYVGLSVFALWWLRQDAEWGMGTLFWLLFVVWATDIGGYAFGLTIGGAKLAPAISPNKTWAGFLGGVFLAALVGWGSAGLLGFPGHIGTALIGAGLAAVSQCGDLFESFVKRRFGVKDSGNLIPGHGGLFDRADGLVAAAMALALINGLGRGNVLLWQG